MGTLQSKENGPKWLARRLEKMGPLFVKVGQYLALRPDILPQEYCNALLSLLDRAPAVGWEAINAVIVRELGQSPDALFAEFRREPIAAGSMAQVHYARTFDGRAVAVKVQRPNLQQQIEQNLRWGRRVLRLFEAAGTKLPISAKVLSAEIEGWLKIEMDLRQESENLTLLGEAYADLLYVSVPEPLAELSTARVLTSEYLEGTPFSELLQMHRLGDGVMVERRGFDTNTLAERLIETTLFGMFTARVFHADPHPGNVIALPGNRIGLIDCGLIGRLGPRLEAAQKSFLSALYAHQPVGLYRALSSVVEPASDSDMVTFRREFIAAATALSDSAGEEEDITGFMLTAMRLAREHRVTLPAGLLSMYRALYMVESVAAGLESRRNLYQVGRRFFAGAEIEQLLNQLSPTSVTGWLVTMLDLTRHAPQQLQELLTQLTEGQFTLTTETRESGPDRQMSNRRALLIALAIVSLAPVIALANGTSTPWQHIWWSALLVIYLIMAITWWRLK